jgi:hypothetical protein
MATIDDKDVIPEGYVQLKDSERTAPRNAKVVGEVDRHEKFAVTIVLRRREDGPALPDFDYFSKTPPRKRMRLSREEFTEKYGAHPDDLKAIEEFARKSGLTVKSSHAGRRHVVVEGTAAQFSKAFGVSFKRYELPPAPQRKPGPPPRARRYRGRDGFIHVPKDLAESIVGIFGLDNRPVSYRASNPGDRAAGNTALQLSRAGRGDRWTDHWDYRAHRNRRGVRLWRLYTRRHRPNLQRSRPNSAAGNPHFGGRRGQRCNGARYHRNGQYGSERFDLCLDERPLKRFGGTVYRGR